ncbi:hypothetical protein [Mycobacteroides abscessus]|uniref:hypothetical protein n=1 Tax=Mycobacteroides abscessus TaxID=36809 RepID=UPI000929E808|nr:hypothetical protein [Mycobacteroides abscessus]SIN11063.1 Uncharacterised protein [Mycobacteroides abscessus subsp. abscessus]SIN12143.1 Uncharacterised protein [Mycobacteroides abscessus subsp. abscessus]SLD62726.1 Uncharacterised protein [Mycobacteroides abscessus subsp. abscessus]SLE74372.1 Uncharacterised protein [Mycobacteroides abscessus subsp. abscessus]
MSDLDIAFDADYCGSSHPDGECSLPSGHKGHHENLYARWPADWGWCIGGDQGMPTTETQYAIEPSPHDCARFHTDELASAIEEVSNYREGALIITRTVTYGPWRYVTPEEMQAAE